jgi:hypothetical protein
MKLLFDKHEVRADGDLASPFSSFGELLLGDSASSIFLTEISH